MMCPFCGKGGGGRGDLIDLFLLLEHGLMYTCIVAIVSIVSSIPEIFQHLFGFFLLIHN